MIKFAQLLVGIFLSLGSINAQDCASTFRLGRGGVSQYTFLTFWGEGSGMFIYSQEDLSPFYPGEQSHISMLKLQEISWLVAEDSRVLIFFPHIDKVLASHFSPNSSEKIVHTYFLDRKSIYQGNQDDSIWWNVYWWGETEFSLYQIHKEELFALSVLKIESFWSAAVLSLFNPDNSLDYIYKGQKFFSFQVNENREMVKCLPYPFKSWDNFLSN